MPIVDEAICSRCFRYEVLRMVYVEMKSPHPKQERAQHFLEATTAVNVEANRLKLVAYSTALYKRHDAFIFTFAHRLGDDVVDISSRTLLYNSPTKLNHRPIQYVVITSAYELL